MESVKNSWKLLIILLCHIWRCHANNPGNCNSLWKDSMNSIANGSQPEFESNITPFALATLSAETYPREKKDIEGWTFISATDNLLGLHAVAYQNNDQPRMILLAIRSVNLEDEVDKQWDLCAHWYMTGSNRPGYDFCSTTFTNAQMDYVQQLQDYVDTIKELPQIKDLDICLALTGHSMGGLITSLYSARYNDTIPGVAFESSGQRKGIAKFNYSGSLRQVYNIYFQHDPIVLTYDSCHDQYGHACKFEPNPPNQNCVTCHQDLDFSLILTSSYPCVQCFWETHDLNAALNIMFKEKTRPNCSPYHGPNSKEESPYCDGLENDDQQR